MRYLVILSWEINLVISFIRCLRSNLFLRDRSIYGPTESRCTENRCHEASDRLLPAQIVLLIFTVKPPIYVPLDGTRTTTGRLSIHSIPIYSKVPSVEGWVCTKVMNRVRDARKTQMHFRAEHSFSRFTSPRCDSLSLNFHILTSGWTRQHHYLTSDGTDISLSWDARVRVGRLRGRRQSDREIGVQYKIANATHDALRVSGARCPHDVRCTTFKIRQIASPWKLL